MKYVVVPRAQHTKIQRRKQCVAVTVLINLCGCVVYAAINFNDQPRGVAIEVGDESPDRSLPAEVKAV